MPITCCVIGGTGFIGRPVVHALLATGRRVIVAGRRRAADVTVPAEVTYVSGDYGNEGVLDALLRESDEVIDLAYATVPMTSFKDPLFDLMANLPPTVRLLREAGNYDLKKIVVFSSGGTVYGPVSSIPIDESQSLNPISPYGITKMAIEKYAHMYSAVAGLPVCMVRPGNAYGPEQAAFTGQGFIATAIQSVVHGKTIGIYGKEGAIRDYVHVKDVASATISVLDDGKSGEAYNIGTGIGSSNRDIVDIIRPLASGHGYVVNCETLPSRPFDVAANVLSVGKIRLHTGWTPSVGIRGGVTEMWRSALGTTTP
jgi:UDP-glucose 4-epimerase